MANKFLIHINPYQNFYDILNVELVLVASHKAIGSNGYDLEPGFKEQGQDYCG